MIRLLSTMFVTCVLLLFAGVWYAGERTAEALAGALAPVVERTRELAKALPKLLAEPGPPAPGPKPAQASPVKRTLRELTPEEVDEAIEEAVEEKIASIREQAFVEAPLDAVTSAPDAEVSDAEAPDPTRQADEEPPDQEEWAALIRRMLVVYRQVGER